MIGVFKHKNPGNILLLLLFGVLIKLPMFFYPYIPQPSEQDTELYGSILKFLEPAAKNFPMLYPLLSCSLLFIQAIVLTRFINNQRMMNRSNYLGGMSYLLLTSLFVEWNYFSAPLLINTFLLYILSALFRSYHAQHAKGIVFNAGLALGLASLIYFPAIIFVIWTLLALMLMRAFRINEWIVCLLGITTPYYFYAAGLFIFGDWDWEKLIQPFTIGLPDVKQSAWLAGSTFLLAVPFLMGSYYVQVNLRRMLIQVRKGWSLLLLFLLTAVIVQFANGSDDFENWILVAVPLAAFHACTYLYSTLRIVPNLLFWLSVVFILAYQYWGPGWQILHNVNISSFIFAF